VETQTKEILTKGTHMRITLEIQRYDPQKDTKAVFKKYEVEINRENRLLDALMKVKQYIDPTLGFRKSCAHGVCGSDAMVVNGVERLGIKIIWLFFLFGLWFAVGKIISLSGQQMV